ncbi:MAG TPA: PAS domain S-box protein [Opitutaceae bacterium]
MSQSLSSAFRERSDLAGDADRFRALLSLNAVGVVEIDAGGRLCAANPKFCAMTGYSEAELRHLGYQDVTHPDDRSAGLEKLEQVRRGDDGSSTAIEQRCVRKDGSELWVSLHVTRIRPESAEAPHVLGVALDLSDRRRAESAVASSEQTYRSLFNSIDEGFCVVEMIFDAGGRPIDYVFLETNAVFESLTGLPNARGARMRDLAPDHEQHWFDIYGRVALTGEPIRFEQAARALNRWYSVYAFRIGETGSRRVGVLFEDITARRFAEQRRLFLADLADKLVPLRDEPAIIRTAVAALGRFLEVDRCHFVECQDGESRLVVSEGYVREGVRAPGVDDFVLHGAEWWRSCSGEGLAVEDVSVHALTRENAERYTAAGMRAFLAQPFARKGAKTAILVVSMTSPRRWTSENATLLEHVAARVWPLVERARSDRALVAAHAELEQRVAERTARLQETLSELETYSYSISHDLRAPLRAMQTYASILCTDCEGRLSGEGREYLRRIMNAAERMDRLIRDVLVFSRVARSAMPMERVDLDEFVAGIVLAYPATGSGAADLELVRPLGSVRANPVALTQCLSNLVENAVKFARPEVRPRLRIWSEAAPPKRRLFVRDNGIGMPPEAQEKIFSMFYQIDPTKGGTGIGLAVVGKAVERMGGVVGVDSRPGEGSTFWIELEDGD